MKYLLLPIWIFYASLCTSQNVEISTEELQEQIVFAEEYINDQNLEFRDPEKSPLHEDSISYFEALDYFPINEDFIFLAKFEKIKKGKKFKMKTSTDRLPVYIDYAILTFEIGEKAHSLHVYKNVELSKKEGFEDYLFIPFNDHTNGVESYGGGRYLDMKESGEDWVILNFNMTYNPYCAYNEKYSCPIPPDENKLEIRIEAGVKKFH